MKFLIIFLWNSRNSTKWIFSQIFCNSREFRSIKLAFYKILSTYLNSRLNSQKLQEEMRRQTERNEKEKAQSDAPIQSKKASEPPKDALSETIELKKKLENYNRDKSALQKLKKRYGVLQKQHDDMKWEMEALQMRIEKLTEERDDLKSKFEDSVLDVQQKSSEFFVFPL